MGQSRSLPTLNHCSCYSIGMMPLHPAAVPTVMVQTPQDISPFKSAPEAYSSLMTLLILCGGGKHSSGHWLSVKISVNQNVMCLVQILICLKIHTRYTFICPLWAKSYFSFMHLGGTYAAMLQQFWALMHYLSLCCEIGSPSPHTL